MEFFSLWIFIFVEVSTEKEVRLFYLRTAVEFSAYFSHLSSVLGEIRYENCI
jgi:hypothetical protein